MQHQGLSRSEASRRLQQFGFNELVARPLNKLFSDLRELLMDPMGLMLLGLSVIYFYLGDPKNAWMMLVSYVLVTMISVVLGVRSNRALRALKNTLSPMASVIRDSVVNVVAARELVPGDLLVFEEGQTLPADGVLVEAEHLTVSEAALTGESIPVEKKVGDEFLSGTIVLTGRALGKIEKTGRASRFASIANLMSETAESTSPLKQRIDRIVKYVFLVALLLAFILFYLEWTRSRQLVPSLIVALTLGMSAIPEEFPIVFTLYLTLGAWRLSKKGVLVKALPSVEALGSVDIICVDKTGTLTEGVFSLEGIIPLGEVPVESLWQWALMACELHAVDAMELAIYSKAGDRRDTLKGWDLQFDYAFELLGKHMSHVWKNSKTGEQLIAMKGSFEGVLEHCTSFEESKTAVEAQAASYSSQGKRLLALAVREGACTGVRLDDEKSLRLVGLLVFSDPIRPAVQAAIVECQRAGVEVKMLTGDHLLTAHAVADEITLDHDHEFIYTGTQLAEMSLPERAQAYKRGAVFARVLPEQKFEMVETLKKDGLVVAMTGDGINDAPALKLADIGISMGKSATDVARSTAKIVLMKNDFTGILSAIFEGRQIFSNMRRSFLYLIAFHIPIVLLALLPPLLGWPSLLFPIHIILMELVVHPVSAFTFENMKDAKLSKNPRGSLLTKTQFWMSLSMGLVLSLIALLMYQNHLIDGVDKARALAFSVLLSGNLFFVFSVSYPALNRRFFVTVLLLVLMLAVSVENAWVASFLSFSSCDVLELLTCFGWSALALVPWVLLSRRPAT